MYCSCQILVKLQFCRQVFEKYSNIKFDKNPSSGSRVDPGGRKDGRTDRYDKANSRFRNFVNTSKKGGGD